MNTVDPLCLKYGCLSLLLLMVLFPACTAAEEVPAPSEAPWDMPTAQGAGAAKKFTGPWDLAALRRSPRVTIADQCSVLTSLYYEGEPFFGKPTRVFAYLARPEKAVGKQPGMVLVHGGGGTAFKEWAELWAKRGYVALAMDLAGQGPDRQRLPDGGPGQDARAKFEADKLTDFWTYHAVANVIRGVSLLASRPEVDPERIGITGISWGGYLTSLIAGLDERLKVAVPVYGCGFIHENSAWLQIFARLSDEKRKLWIENFEPSRYLGQAKMPVLFVNGTNDSSYPLDSYQKSYRLVKDRTVRVTVNLPHSHPAGWAPPEIGLFVDHHLRGRQPLTRIAGSKRQGNEVEVIFRAGAPIVKAALHYTTDAGSWRERKWHTREVKASGTMVRAELPAARPLVYFLTLTDDRAATVSTEHESLDGPPEGFTSLFNGRDLAGWEGHPTDWKVADGCVTGTTDGTLKHNRFLVWRGGQLKNFELRVQVKVTPGGNSGINYRSMERPDLGAHVVTGYQCDVVANRPDYNGMLYEERGRRILAHTCEKVIIDPAGQPWVVGELPLKEFKPGAWHEYRVLVRGNHHQHWIDGHQTVDVIDLDEKGRKLEGVLAVQVHVGPAMTIQYRDIFLKHLPNDLPLLTPDQAKIPATARKIVPQGKDKPKKARPE